MEEPVLLEPIELTEAELDAVSAGAQPNQNAGGGPGNSGPGDKNSPVEGPPPGPDHNFPGQG
jgi:hypothetical protein